MALETIYYISQTIAVVAVIGSLIFVGLQLRQNWLAIRMNAYQAAHERLDHARQMIASDEGLARLYDKGQRDPASLDESGVARFRLLMFVVVEAIQTVHVLFVQSKLSQEEWCPVERMCQRVMATPGGRTWWLVYRSEFNAAFAEEVDRLLGRAAASPPLTSDEWRSFVLRAQPQERDKP